MKKFITALAVLLMCLLAVPTSTVDAAAKINKSKVTVYVGQSTTLKVSGTKKKATWKTSNSKVATVKNGKVTAKKSGTAVITAKVGSKKYTCKVTVKNQELNKKSITLTTKASTTLKLNGAYKKVTWKSSNTKIASVDKNGKVKALKAGTAKVTAKHNGKTYTCKVTVKNPPEKTVVMKVDKDVINDKEMASATNTYLKQLTIKSKKTSGRYVEYTVTKSSYDKMMAGIKNDFNSRVNKLIKQQDVVKKVVANDKLTGFTIYIDQKKLEELNEDMDQMDDNSLEELGAGFGQMIEGEGEAIIFDVLYYQAFSGILVENMTMKFDIRDHKTNVQLYTYRF